MLKNGLTGRATGRRKRKDDWRAAKFVERILTGPVGERKVGSACPNRKRGHLPTGVQAVRLRCSAALWLSRRSRVEVELGTMPRRSATALRVEWSGAL